MAKDTKKFIEESAEEVIIKSKASITFWKNPKYYLQQHNKNGLLAVFIYFILCMFMLLEKVLEPTLITMLITDVTII